MTFKQHAPFSFKIHLCQTSVKPELYWYLKQDTHYFSLFIKKHTLTHCNRSSCLTWNKLFVQFGQLFLLWTYRRLSLAGLTLASIIISFSLLLLSLCSHHMACFILHRHHNGGPEGATATLIQSLPPTTTCTPRKVQCICFLKMLTVTVLVYAHRIINNPCYFL